MELELEKMSKEEAEADELKRFINRFCSELRKKRDELDARIDAHIKDEKEIVGFGALIVMAERNALTHVANALVRAAEKKDV